VLDAHVQLLEESRCHNGDAVISLNQRTGFSR